MMYYVEMKEMLYLLYSIDGMFCNSQNEKNTKKILLRHIKVLYLKSFLIFNKGF